MIHRPARAASRPRDGQPEPASSSGHGRRSYTTGWDAIFIRRFLIHVLPKGFHRIRHYGFLAGSARGERLAQARELLEAPGTATGPEDEAATDEATGSALPTPCPCCGDRMIVIETVKAGCQPRRPPTDRRCQCSLALQPRPIASPARAARRRSPQSSNPSASVKSP